MTEGFEHPSTHVRSSGLASPNMCMATESWLIGGFVCSNAFHRSAPVSMDLHRTAKCAAEFQAVEPHAEDTCRTKHHCSIVT